MKAPAPRRGGNIPHVRALGNATTCFQPATRTVNAGTNSSPNTWLTSHPATEEHMAPDEDVAWTFGGPHPFHPDVFIQTFVVLCQTGPHPHHIRSKITVC